MACLYASRRLLTRQMSRGAAAIPTHLPHLQTTGGLLAGLVCDPVDPNAIDQRVVPRHDANVEFVELNIFGVQLKTEVGLVVGVDASARRRAGFGYDAIAGVLLLRTSVGRSAPNPGGALLSSAIALPLVPAWVPKTTKPTTRGRIRAQNVEATTGIEPVYAVLQTAPWPLGHVATDASAGCPARIRTSVNGSKVRCPTTRRRGIASSSR